MSDTIKRRPKPRPASRPKPRPGGGYLLAMTVLALLAAALLYAQTVTYTLTATQAQDDLLRDIITANNEKLCTTLAAVGGFACSQTQACAAAVLKNIPVGGGSACTAQQARASNVRIWPNTSPTDRTEYITFAIAGPEFVDQKPLIGAWQRIRACLKWGTDNQTARNASCTAAGLPANCQLFDPAVPCM